MDEDEGPHEDLNEHEMSEKLENLIKASKNLMKVVTKSVQMTTIPRASKMNFLFGATPRYGRAVPEEDSHIKRGGMLVVSLRGVNFGFWSHLGCFRQNAIICSRQNLF